jgi:gluconolactonase
VPEAAAAPDAAADAIIDPLAGGKPALITIASGLDYTEGPVWLARADPPCLLFTAGNTIWRLVPPRALSVFRKSDHYSPGLAVDPQGRVVVAEDKAHQVVRLAPDGTTEKTWGGFQAPNDLAIAADGTIYVTDTPANAVLRIAPAGTITREAAGNGPNGVSLSPGGETLYVSELFGMVVTAYPVKADGALGAGRPFARIGEYTDGMAIDDAGDVYTTGKRVRVFDPRGKPLGEIATPAGETNLAFGGADRRTLYITGQDAAGKGALFATQLAIPGKPY